MRKKDLKIVGWSREVAEFLNWCDNKTALRPGYREPSPFYK